VFRDKRKQTREDLIREILRKQDNFDRRFVDICLQKSICQKYEILKKIYGM